MKKIRPYTIAEVSANHKQDINVAKNIIESAAKAGATAIKLQTFTADLMTVRSSATPNIIPNNSDLWAGEELWTLMKNAETPLDWHQELFIYARSLGLDAFSTPYHPESVDFLCNLGVDAIKVSSFDVINIPLLEKVSTTEHPIILSTGMASLHEVDNAVNILSKNNCEIIILKCTSSYPCKNSDANINGILTLKQRYGYEVGFSDHTLNSTAAVAAAVLGATVFEKHIKLNETEITLDSEFSLSPESFKEYVTNLSEVNSVLGSSEIERIETEESSYWERPSIVALNEIRSGERFSSLNIGVRRPSIGLHPKYFKEIQGLVAKTNYQPGEGIGNLEVLENGLSH